MPCSNPFGLTIFVDTSPGINFYLELTCPAVINLAQAFLGAFKNLIKVVNPSADFIECGTVGPRTQL